MRTIFAALVVFVAATAWAGEFNKVLSVGSAAPVWKDLEGTDGKKHSLADLQDKDVIVVVFTCNSCPVARDYEDRIIELAEAHAGKDSRVAVLAINVNKDKADALPAMKERASKRKFPFPYLYDPSQEIARQFGAKYTPEFFVLNKERKIAYLGALDDKGPPREPKSKYVADAIAAVLAGKSPTKGETSASSGCRIKFERSKDDD